MSLTAKLRRTVHVGALVTLGAIGLGSIAIAGPSMLCLVPLTVLTDSMRPTFEAGSLAITQRAELGQAQVGDVVAFHPYSDNAALIIHRVIEANDTDGDGSTDQYVTQGDANGAPDQPIEPAQIAGIMLVNLPMLGWFQQWLIPAGVIVQGIAIAIAYFTSRGFLDGLERARQKRERRADDRAAARASTVPAAPDAEASVEGYGSTELADHGELVLVSAPADDRL